LPPTKPFSCESLLSRRPASCPMGLMPWSQMLDKPFKREDVAPFCLPLSITPNRQIGLKRRGILEL
jgi:hypothetical protein